MGLGKVTGCAALLVCVCATMAYADQVARVTSCTEAIDEEDRALIERAANVRRRPKARIFVARSPSARRTDPNMDAMQRFEASEQRLHAELATLSRRATRCYQALLDAEPNAMGAVTLALVTRDDRTLEVATASTDPLATCARDALHGARTRGAYGTDSRDVVVAFCPSDRPVCVAGPIGLSETRNGLSEASMRALQASIAARGPVLTARYRALGARAPRATTIAFVSVSPRNARISGFGTGPDVTSGPASDAFLDVLDGLTGTCAPLVPWPRSMPFFVALGVR